MIMKPNREINAYYFYQVSSIRRNKRYISTAKLRLDRLN
jgi:hypothetical protein